MTLIDKGLDWAFCDTDSMAIAKTKQLGNDLFIKKAKAVCNWFKPLNPYSAKGPLLKIENANYAIAKGSISNELAPLYCFAISAKRYVLFNCDKDGNPVIRKASAHGLGHLLPPYSEAKAPKSITRPIVPLREIGVEQWQHDYWYCLLEAAIGGYPDRPDLSLLPGFDQPAVSRYAATTPDLLRWFKSYNADKPYVEQVKPFNFLLALQADHGSLNSKQRPRPVAPYASDLTQSVRCCFDRVAGEPISIKKLKTYRQVLAQYHLHPEAKFANGDYLDSGPMHRRHIEAVSIRHIGKEANRWEEQFYLGTDPTVQLDYGIEEIAVAGAIEAIKKLAAEIGVSELARRAGYSRQYVSRIMNGKEKPNSGAIDCPSSYKLAQSTA